MSNDANVGQLRQRIGELEQAIERHYGATVGYGGFEDWTRARPADVDLYAAVLPAQNPNAAVMDWEPSDSHRHDFTATVQPDPT